MGVVTMGGVTFYITIARHNILTTFVLSTYGSCLLLQTGRGLCWVLDDVIWFGNNTLLEVNKDAICKNSPYVIFYIDE